MALPSITLAPVQQSPKDSAKSFVKNIALTGTFKTQIAAWQHPETGKVLTVELVVAIDNDPESPRYDASVHTINGTHYQITYNDCVYKRNFEDHVKDLIQELLGIKAKRK